MIGSIEDLNRATLADVRRFHATYYRPDNAVLVVAGGFDAAQFERWVDRYFAPLKQPATPIPRVTVREPRRTADRRVTLRAPNVPLPALALLWQGPSIRDADAPALRVAAALLAAGESSRLNESLVYRTQLAQQAGFDAALNADAGMLAAYAIAADKAPLAKTEQLLRDEITALAAQPIAEAELDKVRTQLLTRAVATRQTPQGLAGRIGAAVVLQGDARQAERELPQLQAVTAADVQRVLRRYVLGQPRVTVQYLSGGKA